MNRHEARAVSDELLDCAALIMDADKAVTKVWAALARANRTLSALTEGERAETAVGRLGEGRRGKGGV